VLQHTEFDGGKWCAEAHPAKPVALERIEDREVQNVGSASADRLFDPNGNNRSAEQPFARVHPRDAQVFVILSEAKDLGTRKLVALFGSRDASLCSA
jgi:hypothetical protein